MRGIGFRRTVGLATAIALVAAGTPTIASSGAIVPPGLPMRGSQSALALGPAESASKLLEAVINDIPADTFDPAAIVKAVGKDPAALLGWVRDRTYWVPYRGALRGPTGVLMDRLGSSVDRALLLAELLRLAGQFVRLAHGTLTDQAARLALQRMRPVPADVMPATGEDEAALDRYAKQLGLDPQAVRTRLRTDAQAIDVMKTDSAKRVAVQAPFLLSQVGPRPASVDTSASAVAAVRDHWWVQRRDGAGWIDLDPMWPAAREAAGTVAASQTFAFDRPAGEVPLPAEHTHEITIRVVVEQFKDGKVTEKTPLEHTVRPAEVYGQPIVLQVSPTGWPKLKDLVNDEDRAATLKGILVQQTEWVPSIIIGDRAIRQSSFTDSGELKTSSGVSTGAAAAASAIVDMFGGGEPEGQLTAAWIEYETRVPGRPPNKVRRDLFDWFGHKPRAADGITDPAPDEAARNARAVSLATAVQLLPLASRLSPEYVARQVVAGVLRNRDTRLEMLRRAADGDMAGATERAASMKLALNTHLLDLAHARFAWSGAGSDVFLDAPNILSYRTTLFEDASGQLSARQGFDVVTNEVAVRPGAAGDPFDIRLRQGTADTSLEDLLAGGRSTGNASALLGASPVQGGWVVLRNVADPGLARLSLGADVRARIEDQLRRGYIVVAPRAGAADKDQVAWWQIEPKTGSTLGIGSQGWGQALTDVAIFFVGSGFVIFDICMLVQAGARQTVTLQHMAQCGCVGFGGALTLTVAAAGGGLGGTLFVASQAAFGCAPTFIASSSDSTGATRAGTPSVPLMTCSPIAPGS